MCGLHLFLLASRLKGSYLKTEKTDGIFMNEFLFSFAEYLAACCEDEGVENPPQPWRPAFAAEATASAE